MKIGQTVCCDIDSRECSRKTKQGACRSGNGSAEKVSWVEADSHCRNHSKRLCKSEFEIDNCCTVGNECNYNKALVWSEVDNGKSQMLYISSYS